MNLISQSLTLAQSDTGGGIAALLALVIYLGIIVGVIAGVWKTFAKAGEPGWACIVPFYNIIVLLKIAGKPSWWLLLYLIPFVNMVIAILVSIEVAKNFGKGTGFGIGLAFLPFICFPILGFGSAQYIGASNNY